MSLLKRIDDDLVQALKARDKDKATVLRGLKSDIKYRQIDKGGEMTDEDILAVVISAAKKRKESIEQFAGAGRTDLVTAEQAGLDIISGYLPQQLSEAELRDIIKAAIAETGADSPQKLGLVMKVVMPKTKGKADGKLINRIANELLS